ncbi:pirin domain-containing protein [Mucidula mucida]|nr:pirin domain-containing protein [Mucidula mucida]
MLKFSFLLLSCITALSCLVYPNLSFDRTNLPMAAALSSITRHVTKKVLAVETAEYRVYDASKFDTFLMLDHFHVSQGAGFSDHPHRGQATVTYMLEGTSRHEDSAGHKETGGVQWMVAGRGILHAEMPVHLNGAPDPRGLQLWIDLPKEFKMVPSQEPSYQELGPSERSSQDQSYRGKTYGVESPVRHLGGCWYFHVIFDKAGTAIFPELPNLFSAVWKGSVIVGDDSTPTEAYHTITLTSEPNSTGVALKAGADNTEFILDQSVVQYGPFVMTTLTLLVDQIGRNGFEKAHTWQSEIGRA